MSDGKHIHNPTTTTPDGAWQSVRRILLGLWWCIAGFTSLTLLLSAYGGYINPELTTIGALLALGLPLLIIAEIIVTLLSIFINRLTADACMLAMLVCAGPILEYAPINLLKKIPDQQQLEQRAFTFMSYNVLNFHQYQGNDPNDTINPTISYILRQDPDVACLVECMHMEPHYYSHVTQAQADSMFVRYPYHFVDSKGNSLFSKYPIKQIDFKSPEGFHGRLAAYEATIHGQLVTIFSVHMTSIGLNRSDRELYRESTHLDVIGKTGPLRHQLLSKLNVAFRLRAKQAHILRSLIDSVGGENVIVAGDFNDVQDCYALRTIMDGDFKSVYSECGFGPAVTYYGGKFYFRIDHILYRGHLDPLWIKIDPVKYSDHYPLLTQFYITN